ncbi:hypothetical protein D3C76_1548750 [compost metagenome]
MMSPELSRSAISSRFGGLLPMCTIRGRSPFSFWIVLARSSGVMPFSPTTLLLMRAFRPTIKFGWRCTACFTASASMLAMLASSFWAISPTREMFSRANTSVEALRVMA